MRIPQLAASIITPCQELVPIFIETTVGEREIMPFKLFEELEVLVLLAFCLADEFWVGEELLCIMILI